MPDMSLDYYSLMFLKGSSLKRQSELLSRLLLSWYCLKLRVVNRWYAWKVSAVDAS